MSTAYIALGSNLGDRAGTLLAAVRTLNATAGIRVVRLSTFHDTAPVGGPAEQPRFLNAAAELAVTLTPEKLLHALLAIERQFGRTRTEKNGPRTLDLDLLLFDDLVHSGSDPIVPHPRMQERRFVLGPLAEVAANTVHPVLGKTISDLLKDLPAEPPAPQPVEIDPDSLSSIAPLSSPQPGALHGKRALVTGSTSGIGRAIARAFARAGANVIVHGFRSPERAALVVGELAAQGTLAHSLRADLRDRAACQQLADDAWDQWAGLDVVVLNAGADVLTGSAATWPFERKLEALLAVDVTATILLARALGARMQRQGHGAILMLGWDQAEVGMEGDSGQMFAAVKAAIMAFTKSLALTLAPAVRVNCLAPGWIKTAWGTAASDVWQDRVVRETPLRRWGTPEDVAAAAVWLASPAAEFMTGQVVRVNGGAVRS